MITQADPAVRPSIRCQELGCEELASWLVSYAVATDMIYHTWACDRHVADQCNPDAENVVSSIDMVGRKGHRMESFTKLWAALYEKDANDE